MEAIVRIQDVVRNETRNGNTRFLVRDDKGHEYVTFRPPIGSEAERCRGKSARIEFHEEQRGQYKNVYLDAVEAVDAVEATPADTAGDQADAVAWETAAEAAPLIVGSDAQVSGEELFDALKPFKDRVADDIRHGGRVDEREDEEPANVLPLRKGTKRASK